MKVKQLDSKHENYDGKELELNQALYEGGKAFDKIKNDILRYRGLELSNSPGGQKLRAARLSSAQYEDILAGILDYLGSATLQESVRIEASGSEEKTEYYRKLNIGLNALAQDRILKANLHKGSYIAIYFPETPAEVQDVDTQRSKGLLDAKLVPIDGTAVYNHEMDEFGNLEWAKVKSCKYIKDPVVGTLGLIHCWSVITKTTVREYEYLQEIDENGTLKPVDPEAEVTALPERVNRLGVVPLVKLELPTYIIDRLKPIIISHFNRTASVEYSLDASAYQQGYFKGDREISQITVSESTFVHLKADEDLAYTGPDTQHLTALAADCERIDRNLFKAIQAGSLRTPSTDQNTSRLSGIARLREHGSIAVLLQGYADSLRVMLGKAIDVVKIGRGDRVIGKEDVVKTKVAGADLYDAFSMKDDLDAIEKLLGMENIEVPKPAKDYITRELVNSFTSKAPPEVRQKIDAAFDAAEKKKSDDSGGKSNDKNDNIKTEP